MTTAANRDREINAPIQPRSHPIRAPIFTTRSLRIRVAMLYRYCAEWNHDIYTHMHTDITAQILDHGIGWRTYQPSHRFPARSVLRLPKGNVLVHQSGHGIQSIVIHPSIHLLRP